MRNEFTRATLSDITEPHTFLSNIARATHADLSHRKFWLTFAIEFLAPMTLVSLLASFDPHFFLDFIFQ
jgi:ABC-type uncharacterized transport system substrate-binding protein